MQEPADEPLNFKIHVPFRTAKVLIYPILGLLGTGVVFLALGFALWHTFLWFITLPIWIEPPGEHLGQDSGFLFSHVTDFLIICYNCILFVAAFLLARLRWRYRPAVSSAIAYLAFLAFYLPGKDWSRAPQAEMTLFIPLVTSPIGALLGDRLIGKHQPVKRPIGRIVAR